MRVFAVAVMALLVFGVVQAEPVAAQDRVWVYPERNFTNDQGRMVFPTSDGRQFGSVFEREAYLRQTRELPRQVEQSAAEARRQQRAAASAGPAPSFTPPDRVIRREPTVRSPSGYRRELREDSLVRQQSEQHALQRFLDGTRRTDAATTRADLSTVRLGRAQQLATGMDRLYSGAAAARATLGESERRPIGPLIRVPRIGE